MNDVSPLQDLEAAELAFGRVRAEIEALPVSDLAAMNVDVVSATSIALGVSGRVLAYRDRMAKLPEFEVRAVDKLVDYAKAAWFAYVTNLPAPESADATAMMTEVGELRAKLLMWAAPLAASGKMDATALAKIKEGSGNKDAPSDLVALVGLYRANWDAVKNICGVTEADLDRGALIGPAVFASVSRRENQAASSLSDGNLRVRRAWTLLDRAYDQCRRALAFLRYQEGDADLIAPSLRRNAGVSRSAASATEATPSDTATPAVAPVPGGAPIGGGAAPFTK